MLNRTTKEYNIMLSSPLGVEQLVDVLLYPSSLGKQWGTAIDDIPSIDDTWLHVMDEQSASYIAELLVL